MDDRFSEIWEQLVQPKVLIIYIAIIMAVIVAIVISVMVNEFRFNKVTKRIIEDAKHADEQRQEDKENQKKQQELPRRFDMLSHQDEEGADSAIRTFDDSVTFKRICEEFQMFAAGKLGLYYDISDIRKFVSGLAVSRILILQGMSGTGKTSLAYAFGEFLENPSTIIPVQPMWKERTDLIGYYNEFTKRFNETLLLQKMYEANGREEMYITILDELNIARVEYYFAEFLSLLEIPNPESRYLEVVSDRWRNDPQRLKNGRIKLPENMWFLGTANNDDSTFAISDKVYDRAMVLNLNKRSQPLQAASYHTLPVTAKKFVSLVEETVASSSVSKEVMEKLKKLDEYLIEKFQITFGNRIMRQIKSYLPIYVACGGTELEALDDILTQKVLRKLETQNTAYLRSESEELCNFIDSVFGEENMKQSKEYIRRVARNV